MKVTLTSLAFAGCLLLSSCGETPTTAVDETIDEAKKATETVVEETKSMRPEVGMAMMSPLGDRPMKGSVTFTEVNGKVTMTADLRGLVQGEHAIHIHDIGDCSSADGKSAGGHWNPTGEDHGKWGKKPFHRGDIGNLKADKNGTAKMSLSTELWCVGCDDPKKNVLGHAIIIHEGIDDCTSQPSGAAGSRIACGVIEKM